MRGPEKSNLNWAALETAMTTVTGKTVFWGAGEVLRAKPALLRTPLLVHTELLLFDRFDQLDRRF
jgi:hypothetical protein